MQALHADILAIQESQSVPSIAWEVVFKINGMDYDVSDRLMTGDPGIIDSADYRENLTYVNELSLKLNNEDGYITNQSGTGVLDVDIDSEIEVVISGYFNVAGGIDHKIAKYGGWIDLKRLKPNFTEYYCEVGIYSYLGLGDYVSAANITTQYFDTNGLILWSTGLWVRNANITGKVLKLGIHSIETKTEEGYFARLDDGEWVEITPGAAAEYTLSNIDDSQQVTIYFYSLYEFVTDAISYIVVTEEGEQYPQTFYYYTEIRTVIKEAFKYLKITNTSIERYDIPTYDERKVLSIMKTMLGDMITDAASVVSDGEYKFFISVATPSPTNLNQIWYYNSNTEVLEKIYETGVNTFTKHRLVYEPTLNYLFAFYSNPEEDEDNGMLQAINLSNNSYQTIYTNAGLENADVYIRFLYYAAETCFFLIQSDGIDMISNNGAVSRVLNDSGIETNGMSFIYEDYINLVVWLYYTKNDSGTRKVYRVNPSEPGTPEYIADFFTNSDYNNYYCTPFYSEGYVLLIHNNNVLKKFTLDGHFSDISLGGLEIYSLFEYAERMYCFLQSSDLTDKRIGYITNSGLEIESGNINDVRLFKINTNWIAQRQKLCQFKNINNEYDLALISNRPGFLFRWSKWVTPFIYGEFDYTSKTIRELLQETANNYLGFIRVSYAKVGQFISRDSTLSNNSITIQKKYIKDRSAERVYSEKYNGVKVSNGTVDAYYGNRAVNAKTLSLDLQFVADEIVMDMAKYFYDYYQILRKLFTIKYIPTFYNYDAIEKANLSELGLGIGKIHKLSPKESVLELTIMTEDE